VSELIETLGNTCGPRKGFSSLKYADILDAS
jgi:hypothetical protein